MKLWVDDLRPPPDDTWDWVKTSTEACAILYILDVEEMSLDHDLGEGVSPLDHGAIYDTKPIIYWLIDEAEQGRDCWPRTVSVHSANPVGAEWLRGMIRRYKP